MCIRLRSIEYGFAAVAIVYGIGSETQNLGREATDRVMAAYQAFWPRANMRTLCLKCHRAVTALLRERLRTVRTTS